LIKDDRANSTRREKKKGEMKKLANFGLLMALAATLGAAQQASSQNSSQSSAQNSVQKDGDSWTSVTNGSLTGVHNLHINADIGAVQVSGGANQGISYVIRNRSYEPSQAKAQRQFDSYKVSAYVRGDTAWIVGDWKGGRLHKFASDVIVTVPREMELVKIQAGGGAVVATGIAGRLEANSGGGTIHLDDIGGAIVAETGGDAIDVGNVGSDLTVRTGGGAIHIGSAKGKVIAESGGGNLDLVSGSQGASLETGAGSIHVQKCTGEVKASTGGGSIDLGEIIGSAKMEAGGGSLKIGSASGPVKAETGGGVIELWGVPVAHVETGAGAVIAKFISAGSDQGGSELETGVGDITVYLMPNVNLTIHASIEAASGHRILSDFPEIKVSSEGGQWGPKLVTAEGNLNGGGPVLKVRTSMGNIYIRRAQ
jgi:hypothetical protein